MCVCYGGGNGTAQRYNIRMHELYEQMNCTFGLSMMRQRTKPRIDIYLVKNSETKIVQKINGTHYTHTHSPYFLVRGYFQNRYRMAKCCRRPNSVSKAVLQTQTDIHISCMLPINTPIYLYLRFT